jgi:hypothetical protein
MFDNHMCGNMNQLLSGSRAMHQKPTAIPVPYQRREAVIAGDGFVQRMRERGLSVAEARPIYTDPTVIRQPWLVCPNGAIYGELAFYRLFGINAFRKLLRTALMHTPCPTPSLASRCPDTTCDQYLTFLQDQELLEREHEMWKRGIRLFMVKDIGHSLEWYIAEWFRRTCSIHHLIPVRHGVTCYRGFESGDLDVVALLDHATITVECKSASHVSTQELFSFLQRARIFWPAIAILLIDTPNPSLDGLITRLNALLSVQAPSSLVEAVPSTPGIYWGADHLCVTSVPESLDASLTKALQVIESRRQSQATQNG